MARAIRESTGSDYAIGLTGVAGPDPQEGVPPGTVHIAVATPELIHASTSTLPNQGRDAVRRRAVTTSLLMVRRALFDQLKQ